MRHKKLKAFDPFHKKNQKTPKQVLPPPLRVGEDEAVPGDFNQFLAEMHRIQREGPPKKSKNQAEPSSQDQPSSTSTTTAPQQPSAPAKPTKKMQEKIARREAEEEEYAALRLKMDAQKQDIAKRFERKEGERYGAFRERIEKETRQIMLEQARKTSQRLTRKKAQVAEHKKQKREHKREQEGVLSEKQDTLQAAFAHLKDPVRFGFQTRAPPQFAIKDTSGQEAVRPGTRNLLLKQALSGKLVRAADDGRERKHGREGAGAGARRKGKQGGEGGEGGDRPREGQEREGRVRMAKPLKHLDPMERARLESARDAFIARYREQRRPNLLVPDSQPKKLLALSKKKKRARVAGPEFD